MIMKKNFTKPMAGLFLTLGLLFTVSCDDDDNGGMTGEEMPTCSDGIMNGDETGVDCGGTVCAPCEDGMEMGRRAELFVTNNSNGDITKYSITGDSLVTYRTASDAAEGIYYNKEDDLLVQASRSSLQLEAFKETSMIMEDTNVIAAFNGAMDLESPRELAVSGSTYVVADTGSHKFFVYDKSGDSFMLTATLDIPFPVWGITFKGKDLYAVVDTTSDLAVFYDFAANAQDGLLRPSKRVKIEGIVRTHGLTYSAADDTMVMTDIGDAANTTDDGGFHIIKEFSSKFDALSDGDVLPVGMQIRVAGPSTLMGNPIDVAYDSETDAIYVSEVGNGKVLGFTSIGDGGDLAPSFNMDLEAASSIYFSSDETDMDMGMETMGQETRLYATSTANGNITVYDGMGAPMKTILSASTSTEGIYYSPLSDDIIQASRSGLMLESYADFSSLADASTVQAAFMSDADLMSPREIAVSGYHVVVADNGENKLYVYTFNGSSFTLQNTLQADFDLWGITFMGDDLLAVVDNTSDLAIFNNFIDMNMMDGSIMPDKQVTVEGIVRTHGIDYSEASDVLVMTDIGAAADANTDGGFHVIQDFTLVIDALEDGATIPMGSQSRVAGPSTMMGNPIDVAYDHKTETVFIAEVGNGKVLGFANALNSNGDVAPTVSNDLMNASSIYLYNN